MLNRRSLVLGSIGAAVVLKSNALEIVSSASAASSGDAQDDTFWLEIARAYHLDGRYIVLNGGGNNPHPRSVTDALNTYNQLASMQPRPYSYRFQAHIDQHRVRLANLMGCTPGELAITRNTTEGLNIVAAGTDFEPGDHIISNQFEDRYAGKIFEQYQQRKQLDVTVLELPVPSDPQQVIQQVADAMTPRTRLIVMSHIVDGWGFVLPVKEIADIAHQQGAKILVDGALSFGAVPVNVRDMNCDYYATSLHKWLNAPLGTGALYVREDNIESLWPFYGSRREANDIRKFEDIGTRSGPTIGAIGQAIDLYEAIGPERKAERLRYLLSLVIDGLEGVQGVDVITESNPELRSGLARVAVAGLTGVELSTLLRDEYRISTYGNFPGPFDGVYISPNVFNSVGDMNAFVSAIKSIASSV